MFKPTVEHVLFTPQVLYNVVLFGFLFKAGKWKKEEESAAVGAKLRKLPTVAEKKRTADAAPLKITQ